MVFHRNGACGVGKKRHREYETMKKIGVAAAILIVALLVTGVVSALATTEKPEKITITQIGPDTAMSSDGQIIKMTKMKVDNETQIGEQFAVAGPDRIKIGVIHDPASKGVSGSVAPGYADLWGPFSWNAGYPASVYASWTPTNQGVYLGIYDMANPSWAYVVWKTGGSGTYSGSVPYASSQWTYAILNPSSNTATVNYALT
jgi:hypothetical protein